MSDERPSTIIAACDGGDRGRQAVVVGRLLAEASHARLLVAAVYPHPALPFPPVLGHHVDERRTADRAIRAVRDELAPGAETVVVPGFSPAHALCDLAAEQAAQTILVGSHHAAHGRRMGDADHALQVLRSASTAVLVVPDERPAPRAIRRIVVGFDEGAGARDALVHAVEIARATGADLRLVCVVPRELHAWWVAGDAMPDPGGIDRWVEDRRRALANTAREALDELGVGEASAEVIEGNAVPELLAAGAEADLLVLGSRRWARLARLALGSVSEPIVRRSTCPTLVVPRPHTARKPDDAALSAAARA